MRASWSPACAGIGRRCDGGSACRGSLAGTLHIGVSGIDAMAQTCVENPRRAGADFVSAATPATLPLDPPAIDPKRQTGPAMARGGPGGMCRSIAWL